MNIFVKVCHEKFHEGQSDIVTHNINIWTKSFLCQTEFSLQLLKEKKSQPLNIDTRGLYYKTFAAVMVALSPIRCSTLY